MRKLKKAQIGNDKLMVLILVLAVVAIVVIGIVKLDIIGKIKNIFPSFNQTIDEKVDIEKCPFPIAKLGDDKIIRFCTDEYCTKTATLNTDNSRLYFNEESKEILVDTILPDLPFALVASNQVYLREGILEGTGSLYYGIGESLPPYSIRANFEGSKLIGKYFCRDKKISFDVPEGFEEVGSIAFLNNQKRIYIHGGDIADIYFDEDNPEQILLKVMLSKRVSQEIVIGKVSDNKISLDLKEVPRVWTSIDNPSLMLKMEIILEIDKSQILGDIIIKEKT